MESKNTFLESFSAHKSKFGKYISGSLLLILFNLIGSIPYVIYVGLNEKGSFSDSISDFLNGAILSKNLPYFLLLLSFVVVFIGFYIVIKRLHKQTFLSVTTSRSKIDIQRIITGFLVWGILCLLSFLVAFDLSPDDFVLNFNLFPFIVLTILSLLFIPLQAGIEEYIFRGYLMQGFATLFKNRWAPLLITSIIFGLLHLANPEIEAIGYELVIVYILSGLFFGIITLLDDGIELALGVHIANNLLLALLVTTDWTILQTDSIFIDTTKPSEILVSYAILEVFIMSLIALLIFNRKYGWKNWKYKLTAPINETKN